MKTTLLIVAALLANACMVPMYTPSNYQQQQQLQEIQEQQEQILQNQQHQRWCSRHTGVGC